MKFVIKDEIRGRLRVQALGNCMSIREADTLQYYLEKHENIRSARINRRILSVTVAYDGDRREVIAILKAYKAGVEKAPENVLKSSSRALEEEYWEKLVVHAGRRLVTRYFLPYPVRSAVTIFKSARYIRKGLAALSKRRLDVSVLDATAIGVSVLRGDFDTAGSVMFLLGMGEILEEWTHKKSVGDLARSMSIGVDRVWILSDGQEVLTDVEKVTQNDLVVVRVGGVIPFDGTVEAGEAMVNQASITGESVPAAKRPGTTVYAGTVVEEGELTIRVSVGTGNSKFERITAMIEESEKLKSQIEGKAEHLADALVPYTLGGAALIWLLSKNVTKMLSVLMVDFSCALKLAIPISVLSAIREAGASRVTVKGGKYLEAVAEADTVVFDKTGTLTKARPTVADVVTFGDISPDEALRLAACMEEHFPHSMAKAVVDAAKMKNLRHEERHSKVEYIVAHGISTSIDGKKAVIGSHHFVFEDEHCSVPDGAEKKLTTLSPEYSHLFMAIEGVLRAVICIEDPIREEAAAAVRALKEAGISKVVMMTGDSERTAKAVAEKTGVDEYFSEVLPEDKARFVEEEKAKGRKVIMVGDGINDSPALSAADAGIAVSDGAELAREIADITVGADDLWQLVRLKKIADALMIRIHTNYRVIVGFNAALIALGVTGVLQPTVSALLHNTSTIIISLNSMKPVAGEREKGDGRD